jgi:hypothetical protein
VVSFSYFSDVSYYQSRSYHFLVQDSGNNFCRDLCVYSIQIEGKSFVVSFFCLVVPLALCCVLCIKSLLQLIVPVSLNILKHNV